MWFSQVGLSPELARAFWFAESDAPTNIQARFFRCDELSLHLYILSRFPSDSRSESDARSDLYSTPTQSQAHERLPKICTPHECSRQLQG